MSKVCQAIWLTAAGLILILAGCKVEGKDSYGANIDREAQKARLVKQIDSKFENPEAHYRLGKLYHADGRYDKAEYEYNIAIGFDPVQRRAQAGLVKLLMDTRQADKAGITAETYISQAAASAEDSSLLGKAFEGEGLDEYAVTCYRQALDIATNSAALYKQLGYYYLTKGDKSRAEENLRRSFELDPYQRDVAGELGKMGIMVQVPRQGQSQAADKASSESGSQ